MWWEIIDDNGTLFTGTEDEMRGKYMEIIANEEECLIDNSDTEFEYEGDLRLIHLISVHR